MTDLEIGLALIEILRDITGVIQEENRILMLGVDEKIDSLESIIREQINASS